MYAPTVVGNSLQDVRLARIEVFCKLFLLLFA